MAAAKIGPIPVLALSNVDSVSILLRWMLRPPGWPLFLLTAFPLVYAWWTVRQPGGAFAAGMVYLFLAILVGVLWVIRVLGFLALDHPYVRPKPHPWSTVRWVATPLVLCVGIFVSDANFPRHLAFNYSRSDMERLVRRVLADPNSVFQPQWAGLIYIHAVEVIPEGVRLRIRTAYDGVPAGYAFRTGAAEFPQLEAETKYYPVSGPWFEYWDHAQQMRELDCIPSTSSCAAAPTR